MMVELDTFYILKIHVAVCYIHVTYFKNSRSLVSADAPASQI